MQWGLFLCWLHNFKWGGCLKDAWNFKGVHPITFITFKTTYSFCFFSETQNEMEVTNGDQWLSVKIFCEEWKFRHRLLSLMSLQIDNNVLKNLGPFNESQNNIGPCWLPLYSQNPPHSSKYLLCSIEERQKTRFLYIIIWQTFHLKLSLFSTQSYLITLEPLLLYVYLLFVLISDWQPLVPSTCIVWKRSALTFFRTSSFIFHWIKIHTCLEGHEGEEVNDNINYILE